MTVLIAIAIIGLYAAETSARVVREARITKLKESSELAFYTSEAGFNRVRARIIKNAPDTKIRDLDGRSDILRDDAGSATGEYRLSVEQPNKSARIFLVVSTGTSGAGKTAATRKISGTITVTGTKPNSDDLRVETVYNP